MPIPQAEVVLTVLQERSSQYFAAVYGKMCGSRSGMYVNFFVVLRSLRGLLVEGERGQFRTIMLFYVLMHVYLSQSSAELTCCRRVLALRQSDST